MANLNDPRSKNKIPEASTISDYLSGYLSMVQATFEKADLKDLNGVLDAVEKAVSAGKRIYVAGNGGSDAISNHLCCDWVKGTHYDGKPPVRVQSLSANSSLFTALANDFGYEHSFSRQVEMLCESGDVLLLISSSGNSENILRAAAAAKKKQMTVVGFTGFSGGKLKDSCDLSLHLPVENYGAVEDGHQMLMHVIAQFLAKKRES